MTYACLVSEMQIYKPLCRLHWYTRLDSDSHIPCKFSIGFGLIFVLFACTIPIFSKIKGMFNRLLRFAITWRLHYSKSGEA